MKAIGIDIGTTSISIVVLDLVKKKVLASRCMDNDSFLRAEQEGQGIQDPTLIFKRTMDALDEIIGNYPDFSAIGITGQMHGIVYIDGMRRFASPLYTWQDESGNRPDAQGNTMVELVRQRYGIPVASGYGLITYLCHKREGKVPANARYMCTIMDYIAMRLSGRPKPLMHVSNAASLGFYDVKEGLFQTKILSELGVDLSLIPEVTSHFEVLGSFRGIPVYTAIGDNQASFLGAVGTQENSVLVNMGTGGQISVLSDTFFEAPGIEARPIYDGHYLLAGSSLCGGRAYAVVEHFFRTFAVYAGLPDIPQYDLMARILSSEKESSPLKIETTFKGTRFDPDKKGSIIGITEENLTPVHLIRGTLEGMAQELYDMYHQICEGTNLHCDRLYASGNGLRKNPALMEIFQKKFQMPLLLAPFEEEAACGAAISTILKG